MNRAMRNLVLLGVALIVVGVIGLFCVGRAAWDGAPGSGWGPDRWPVPGGMWRHHVRGPWARPGMGAWALPPAPGARTVEVVAADFSFNPVEVQIRTGEVVNISLVNKGNVVHDITVPGLRFRLVAPPGQTAAGAIRAVRPGTYAFFCSITGHRESGMAGRIVVAP